jgi:uncharacterized OB-fold protein
MTLLRRDPSAPQNWQGEMPIANRYTYGIAGERFFRAIQEEGRILGTYCSNCDHTYVPAAAFCERCMNQLDEWVDVGTTGEVVTFTHLYINMDDSPKDKPETVAFIRLGDGGLIHRLVVDNPSNLTIGMQAEIVFKPLDERKGSILDIDYFQLISEEQN